jgi:hypothetical protein
MVDGQLFEKGDGAEYHHHHCDHGGLAYANVELDRQSQKKLERPLSPRSGPIEILLMGLECLEALQVLPFAVV